MGMVVASDVVNMLPAKTWSLRSRYDMTFKFICNVL